MTKIHGNVNFYLLCAPLAGMRFRFKRYFCWRRCRLPRTYVKIRLVASSLPPQYHLKFRNGVFNCRARFPKRSAYLSLRGDPWEPWQFIPSLSLRSAPRALWQSIFCIAFEVLVFRPAKARQKQRATLYLYPPPSLRDTSACGGYHVLLYSVIAKQFHRLL